MDLFIIEHYQEDESIYIYSNLLEILMGYLQQLDVDGVKALLTTMNKYRLWNEFQKIAVCLIKLLITKINENLHDNVHLLVEILKYSIVDATVLQVSQFFSCVTDIINKMYNLVVYTIVIEKMRIMTKNYYNRL